MPDLTSSFQFGNSSFGDSLTFLGNFTGQQATFNISVDGTWSGATSFNGSDFQFMVLPAGTIDANADNTLNIFNNPGNVALVNEIMPLTPTTTNPLTFSVSVTLSGLNPTIEFAANLNIVTSTDLGQSFTADYSNTATISLAAPDGVTVVSGSGVFPGTGARALARSRSPSPASPPPGCSPSPAAAPPVQTPRAARREAGEITTYGRETSGGPGRARLAEPGALSPRGRVGLASIRRGIAVPQGP